MRSLALAATFALTTAAAAANIDMDDPRRALGREGDVRIDAQLSRDTLTAGQAVGITYQVQNLSTAAVAVATKVADASYDEENRTVVLAVGSEVPPDGNLPQMVLVAPGETKVFTAAATPAMRAAAMRSTLGILPRFVQVKVAILRNVAPYIELIRRQDGRTRQRLSDPLFEQWFESNETIYLNSIPVRFTAPAASDIERRQGRW
ncbi:MAG TPA: hypothetical protein VND45_05670 [Thermoanaerobaculia bacterium]|jgi:hypothetical protein|nr:hypothetical protein [Thermoanaerobaculia bacterium]